MDQSVAMAVLKGSLQKNDLLFSLEKRYPKDFADLLAWAEGYARAEEAFKLKDEEATREWQAGKSSKPAIKEKLNEVRSCSWTLLEHKRARTPPRAHHQRSPDRKPRRGSSPKRFHNYASLNAPKMQV